MRPGDRPLLDSALEKLGRAKGSVRSTSTILTAPALASSSSSADDARRGHDVGALVEEGAGDGQPDAATGARGDGYPSLQPEIHQRLPGSSWTGMGLLSPGSWADRRSEASPGASVT
ncbi:MAG: hypothetical protein QOI86_3636 [Actinomycetota bacterium]|nr:hypothetical protein [Actinomycetota bacterium]